jgi:hypothetical protein
MLSREKRLELLEQVASGGQITAGSPQQDDALDVARRIVFACQSAARPEASAELIVSAQGIAAALLDGSGEWSEEFRSLFNGALAREVVLDE